MAVDLFLFPNAYIDVATIGALTSFTGGQLYRYNFFKVRCLIIALGKNVRMQYLVESTYKSLGRLLLNSPKRCVD